MVMPATPAGSFTPLVYAVPQALVFRSWAVSNGDATSRRLLLRNTGSLPMSFRLTLPKHAALRVTGECVKRASFDLISSVELPPNGTTALVVDLLHGAAAEEAELRDELLVRTQRETIHVPLVALRDAKVPTGGEPTEIRSAPSVDEYWDEDDSDDDQRPICSAHGRPSSAASTSDGGGSSSRKVLQERLVSGAPMKLTPAPCTESDELAFYRKLMRDDAIKEAAAAVGPPPAAVLAPPQPPPPRPSGPVVRMVQVDGKDDDDSLSALRAGERDHGSRAEARRDMTADDEDEEVVNEELAFYRSFVAGKRQAERTAAAEAVGASAGIDDCDASFDATSAARPTPAQVQARRAIANGTYFTIGGMVTDSRGRELGLVDEILGPECAKPPGEDGPPLPPPPPPHAARLSAAGGGAASLHGVPTDHAALYAAGLDTLRDALGGVGAHGNAGRMPLDSSTHWRPGGAAALFGTGIGESGAEGGTGTISRAGMTKGGGGIIRSTAPKSVARLTEEEMEANWTRLG